MLIANNDILNIKFTFIKNEKWATSSFVSIHSVCVVDLGHGFPYDLFVVVLVALIGEDVLLF